MNAKTLFVYNTYKIEHRHLCTTHGMIIMPLCKYKLAQCTVKIFVQAKFTRINYNVMKNIFVVRLGYCNINAFFVYWSKLCLMCIRISERKFITCFRISASLCLIFIPFLFVIMMFRFDITGF